MRKRVVTLQSATNKQSGHENETESTLSKSGPSQTVHFIVSSHKRLYWWLFYGVLLSALSSIVVCHPLRSMSHIHMLAAVWSPVISAVLVLIPTFSSDFVNLCTDCTFHVFVILLVVVFVLVHFAVD